MVPRECHKHRRGDTGGTHQADKQGIKVGAFAAEIAALEQSRNVADAAATSLRIAECVFDNPFVDGMDLFDLGLLAGNNLVRRLLDDAVDRDEFVAGRVEFSLGGAEIARHLAGLGQICGAIAGENLAGDFDDGSLFAFGPLNMQHLDAVFRIARLHCLAVGRPLIAFGLEPFLFVD